MAQDIVAGLKNGGEVAVSLIPGGGVLVPHEFDYISIPSYNDNDDPLVVIYKLGGVDGQQVARLDITYHADGNISTVERTDSS